MKYRQEIKQKIIAGRQTRTVYKYKTHYRKYWNHRDTKNCSVMAMPINQHIDIVNNFFPEYIIGSKVLKKSMWIDYNTLPGISANKFEHTEEFIKKIKNFCIDNINKTKPYAHFDWHLGNIIINGDDMYLIDWDNIREYTDTEIDERFELCMKRNFGDKY